jgi:hypothetical protein
MLFFHWAESYRAPIESDRLNLRGFEFSRSRYTRPKLSVQRQLRGTSVPLHVEATVLSPF